LLKLRSGPIPYTQQDRSQAAAKLIRALKRKNNVVVNIQRSAPVNVGEKYGMLRIATAVNKKLAARPSGLHRACNPQ
jgi:hypothetical protein